MTPRNLWGFAKMSNCGILLLSKLMYNHCVSRWSDYRQIRQLEKWRRDKSLLRILCSGRGFSDQSPDRSKPTFRLTIAQSLRKGIFYSRIVVIVGQLKRQPRLPGRGWRWRNVMTSRIIAERPKNVNCSRGSMP